jgi:hypothetical protein
MCRSISWLLILFVGLTCQIAGQALLKNGKIPKDLLIVLKHQDGWGGAYSEMTINARGEFSFLTRGGLPAAIKFDDIVLVPTGERPRRTRYLKPKLSQPKLASLLAEFERIQFFGFGPEPPPDDLGNGSFSDAGWEGISIRINGQTKEVGNYLGDTYRRTRILKDLAEKIRGAAVWNFEGNEIPENFGVTYGTDFGRLQRNLRIACDGTITEELHSTVLGLKNDAGETVPYFTKTRAVAKVSRKQVRYLIDEFEKIGFSGFRFSNLAKYDGCSNPPDPNAEKRTNISVTINRVHQMYASLYQNCGPVRDTDAAKFEYMDKVIQNLLRSVGVDLSEPPRV